MKQLVILLILLSMPLSGFLHADVIPEPFNLGLPLNTSQDDFAPSITEDGLTMVFNSKRSGNNDIYITHFKNGSWSEPEAIKEINSKYNDQTPYVSEDGSLIIFSSDRDESKSFKVKNNIYVSFDLYISAFEDGTWSSPVPVPGIVNSTDHEEAPSLSPDGQTLYFTRRKFGKNSKTIIMKANLVDMKFTEIQPLPAPINTGNSERGLIETEEGYYFSSYRPGGFGDSDIYFVSVKDGKLGNAVNLGPFINSERSEFFYSKKNYTAYFCSTRKHKMNPTDRFDIYRASFDIPATYFDFNSSRIKPETAAVLNDVAQFFKKNKNMIFEIAGHTDLHGTESYNQKLSQKRAESVEKFLIQKGLSKKQFRVRGAGMSEPVKNGTGKGFDEFNRRTEFRFLGFIR
ncbi:MAG: OmpA family protein [Spirochaetia bacterium]|nr:OmpA family protein [Spirochaetia bacterium]